MIGSFFFFFFAIFFFFVTFFRLSGTAVLPSVSQHGMFQSEATRADVALVRPFTTVSSHVTS
jgi:hypothetical protein